MTRRSIATVLGSLLVSAFTLASAHPVGACELDTCDRCVQPSPIEAGLFARAIVAVPTTAMAHIDSGYAPEHYEQMLAQQPTN